MPTARPALVLALALALLLPAMSRGEEITWTSRMAGLFAEHCQECHRPGSVAPMSLLTYRQVRAWSRSIARAVEQGRMPPWHADPRHGVFANDRRLSADDTQLLLGWIRSGLPWGEEPEREPTAPAEPAVGWRIGEPDLVFELPEEVVVPPDGEVPYHDYTVPSGLTEDVWIQAAEARPGNDRVVHHIIVGYSLEDPGAWLRRRSADEEGRTQGSLGGYVPGDDPLVLPEGLGLRIPAGATIYFQMHYTPTGRVEKDRSRLGLRLARVAPRYEAKTGLVSNPFIFIPAGREKVSLEASYVFRRDSMLLSMRPHLHLRGKTFEYRAVYADGREEILLRVPDYDFGWQTTYLLAEPKPMPAGTELRCAATWDNSRDNPENPDPSRNVSWGEQTDDEMMIGFFQFYTLEAVKE